MEEEKYRNLKMGERGAVISIVAYIFLSILKLVIGYTSNSAALRADGLNNTTDIIASIAVLIGLKLSQIPPDSNHRYGHWKSETIASLMASFIMAMVGIQVLIDIVTSIFQGQKETPDITAAYVGVFSSIIMYMVYRYNKNLSQKINSGSVMAAAKDNLSDAWVSIGTAVGIFAAQLNMPWIDTMTAIIVGLLICKTAWDIFIQSSIELSDGFDEGKIKLYQDAINKIPNVQGIKEIKGRNYGNNEIIDVVILVCPTLCISEAHEIATSVENKMMKEYEVYDVHVHVEPFE
ncbi:cation diffusion facilitator family transporter [Aciduricibacillus chroicocephali]|uniref:Cation diffusion facilitator family transporter n=1 Tax=Aciduricibacillus chroicocephali TaxID=3054939 RepID=A0ABY9KSM5_9BACI|nr:cation diffusion facilitator family transporter [Bacillaceae bacterium 44XB]